MTARRVATVKGLRALCEDESGASLVVVGLALPVVIGLWDSPLRFLIGSCITAPCRMPADSAVIAAATNVRSNYAEEAKAVAAGYGFKDGANNAAVTAANPIAAPGCAARCYTVTVSDKVPLFLSHVVGYNGNVGTGAQRASGSTHLRPRNRPKS